MTHSHFDVDVAAAVDLFSLAKKGREQSESFGARQH